jgi:prepilin-type N-terminal cleavage/methylation domain-containing protein
MKDTRRGGFTLVEALVVIAIIGILLAILFPAVQAAREAARRTHCTNNLKQLGVAMQSHHDSYRRLPTGGWGFVWTGDPDRGTDRRQPGGWVYNILPYVEQRALRELGKGASPADKEAIAATVAQRPLSVFNCPSRRATGLYPYLGAHPVRNAIAVSQVAKTDYAANAGDVPTGGQGPASLEEGDNGAFNWGNVGDATGTLYMRSEVRLSDIQDGTSNTYLVGEKRCITQGFDWGDDQHMYLGHGLDTARYTAMDVPPIKDGPVAEARRFGSAHPSGCYFVFVDGSVDLITYQIDPEIHRRLGNRKDGLSASH